MDNIIYKLEIPYEYRDYGDLFKDNKTRVVLLKH